MYIFTAMLSLVCEIELFGTKICSEMSDFGFSIYLLILTGKKAHPKIKLI